MPKNRSSRSLRSRLRAITDRFRASSDLEIQKSDNLQLQKTFEQQSHTNQGDNTSMPVLNRSDLEQSSLADLHAIAREVQIDGYRRLRREDLTEAILERAENQDGLGSVSSASGTSKSTTSEPKEDAKKSSRDSERRGSSKGRSRQENTRQEKGSQAKQPARQDGKKEYVVRGTVEGRTSGSALIRVKGDEVDAYLSKEEVKAFALVDGDRVEGKARSPRRGERYATLVQLTKVNDKSARQADAGPSYDELASSLPAEPLKFLEEDKVLGEIVKVAPVGFGSRVAVVGSSYSGKTQILQSVTKLALSQEQKNLEVVVALSGIRPEEVSGWQELCTPESVVLLGKPTSNQAQAVKAVIERAKRSASSGKDVILLIDSLCYFDAIHVRTLLCAARNLVDHGSLTIFAALNEAKGGETTTIALDTLAGAAKRIPIIDLAKSGTLHSHLLVTKTRANAIARAYRKLLDGRRQNQSEDAE